MLEFSSDVVQLLPGYAIKIGAAFVCGLILGVERERKDKPAGMRTIILITVGSTLYMIVSELMALVIEGPNMTTNVDPSRIAAQVVSGIGFLGAGSIIQSRGSVRGLTTAAVIWVAAAIGLCIGAGFPLLAIGITLLVVVTLIAMQPLRSALDRFGDETSLEVIAPNDSLLLTRLRLDLLEHDIPRENLSIEPIDDKHVKLRVDVRGTNGTLLHVTTSLSQIEGVRGFEVLPGSFNK